MTPHTSRLPLPREDLHQCPLSPPPSPHPSSYEHPAFTSSLIFCAIAPVASCTVVVGS